MVAAYRQSQDLLTRKIAGETIVVPIRGKLADMQEIFALNPTAEFIWNRMDGRRDVNRIAEDLSQEFDVEPAQAVADVKAFVGDLLQAGLIEEAT